LHDVLGEEDFQSFLRDYYARWQFRHVDRWAMQASAERIGRKPLGWFFDQWVNRVGRIDYALRGAMVAKDGNGWVVSATLSRVPGSYRHPMPIGVRTGSGWTMARANPASDVQTIRIKVSSKPDAIWLDPFGSVDSPTALYYRLPLAER
jgi:aminopeptidase N